MGPSTDANKEAADQPAPAPLVLYRAAAVIASLAIVMGSLLVTSYSLALGDPVPHRIDAALVGNPTSHPRTVDAVERERRLARTRSVTMSIAVSRECCLCS